MRAQGSEDSGLFTTYYIRRKTMKKLLSLLLVLALVFSFAACGGDTTGDEGGNGDNPAPAPAHDHVDANADDKCDVCAGDMNDPAINPGRALSKAVIAQIENAASVQFEIVTETMQSETDNESGDTEYYYEVKATVGVQLSKTATGVNARVNYKEEVRYDAADAWEVEDDYVLLYLVDGVIYGWDEYDEVYYADEIPMDEFDEYAEVIENILDSVDVSAADVKILQDAIGGAFVEVFAIENGKGTMKIDLKDFLNGEIAYIGSIKTTDTIESVVDHFLAKLGLDADAVIDSLEDLAEMTFSELYTALDTAASTAYGKGLQALYDEIVESPELEDMLYTYADIFNSMMPEDGKMTAEQIEEAISVNLGILKDVDFEELLVEYGLADAVIYDFVMASAFPDEDPEDIPTLPILVATIKEMLNMALEDAIEDIEGVTYVIDIIKGISIGAFDYSTEISLSPAFAIDSIVYTMNLDFSVAETGYGTSAAQEAHVTYTIKNISTSTVAITAPSGAIFY